MRDRKMRKMRDEIPPQERCGADEMTPTLL
jgi:hypothetical protein